MSKCRSLSRIVAGAAVLVGLATVRIFTNQIETPAFDPDLSSRAVFGIEELKATADLLAPRSIFVGLPKVGLGGNRSPAALLPTLGNYPNTSVAIGGNTTITPDAPPTDTVRTTAKAPTLFNGVLDADPLTGVVRVTNASTAGIYLIKVTAYNSGGSSTTKTFNLTVTVPGACQVPVFGAPSSLAAGTSPETIAVGDFNRDGKQDYVAANTDSGNVTVMLGNGAGGFTAEGGSPYAMGTNPFTVVVADFNSDGIQDIATTNQGSSNVAVRLGTGTGAFGSVSTEFVGAAPDGLATGDLNGDGRIDLVVSAANNTVLVLLGNGGGAFISAGTFGTGSRPYSVAVADLNNDGFQDVVTGNINAHTISVLLGFGNGTLGAGTSTAVGTSPSSVVIGDFDNNGNQDVATANNQSSNVSILMGNGTGGFLSNTLIGVADTAYRLAVADMNTDGKQDLVVAGNTNFTAITLYGNGLGGFPTSSSVSPGSSTRSVAVGDLNGDQLQDLLVTRRTANSVAIIMHQACPAPPALGNYTNTSVALGANTTITPSATPANTTGITVSTLPKFTGELTVVPTTGVIRVTNAGHASIAPATYPITVRAIGPGGVSTKTFNLTVTSGTSCAGSLAFSNMPDIGVGPNTNSVAIADFNNDGKQDFASASNNANTVSVRLGDGAGSFTGGLSVAVGTAPYAVKIGDFNNDGNQDFVTAAISSNTLYVRLGDGAGGFTNAPNVGVGTSPYYLIVGDFNNDGNDDLAATATASNTVYVRLGNGAGGFTNAADVGVGTAPLGIALGDFNNDGNQDFAAAAQASNTVYIRLGNGAGGFTNAPDVAVAAGPVEIAVGDFNNDGNQDFATANETSGTVSVRLGTGSGTFTGSGILANGPQARAIAVGDLNNDGKQDILFTRPASSAVLYMLGDGVGGFAAPVSMSNTARPLGLAIGDVNGDGRPDFLTANDTTGSVSVKVGSCYVPSTAAVPYRWQAFNTYDNGGGAWLMGNNPAMYGGVPPSSWTDGNAIAANLSTDPAVLATLIHNKGYGGDNAMIWAEAGPYFSSTNGRIVVTMLRIQNSTASPIQWTPNFYYSAYSAWSERASVALNGNDVWNSGTTNGIGQAAVPITLPANQTSTVIFTSASGPANFSARASQFGFFNNTLRLPSGLSYIDDLPTPVPYRWQVFNTYDQAQGWLMGNDPSMFGGVNPSSWTDNNAIAADMADDPAILATLFKNKGYAGANAMIWSEARPTYSSTNGRIVATMFRITNTTGSPLIWTPSFYYSAYRDWSERASVALNGNNVWNSGTSNGLGQTSVPITIPPNQTSTVIFTSASGVAGGGSDVRASQFGFFNDSLNLPAGLVYTEDLPTPVPYRWQVFNTYDNGTGAWLMGNDPSMFGGVSPLNWTDNSGIAADMSDDPAVLATLLTNKGYAGANALVWAEGSTSFSSTNGRIIVTMLRIRNATANPITWTPNFYASAYDPWGEHASVALNGDNVFNSGTVSGIFNLAVPITLPANQISTVIFTSAASIPSNNTRGAQFGFYNNTLNLPAGLSYVDDLNGTPARTLTAAVAGAGSGSIASIPAGINCPGDCTEAYNDGTPVSLTATPAGGSIFTGWSGACTGLGVCSVTMTQDRSVTANFVPEGTQFSLGGRVLSSAGRPITNAHVVVSGSTLPVPLGVFTGRNGSYSFAGLAAGQNYVVTVTQRRYGFSPPNQTIYLVGNRTDVNFISNQ